MRPVFSPIRTSRHFLLRWCCYIFTGICLASPCSILADEAAEERVVLQLKWTHQFQFAGYYMAKHLGYYGDAGIDLEIRPGSAKMDVTDEVLTGRADFGVGTSSLLLDYAAGKPVVVLGVIYQHSPMVILMHTESPSDTIERLAEGRIMLESHAGDLMAMLHRSGLPIDELDITDQPPNAMERLRSTQGIISASAYQTDEPYTLQQKGVPFVTLSPRTYGVDFYGDNFFTSEKMLKENKSLVERFRKATIRGWEEALRDPGKAVDLILKEYPAGIDREKLLYEARITQDLMTNLVAPGHMNVERWDHIADTFLEAGMLDKKPDLAGFVFEENPRILPKWFWPSLLGALLVITVLALVANYFRTLNIRLKRAVDLRLAAETHLKSSNIELTMAKKEADDANLQKTRFITNVSHDLRAPVSAMISLTQIFNHHSKPLQLPAKFNRFLGQLNSGGEFLMMMLNNILDQSAFELNAVSVYPEEVDLEKSCASIVNLVQPLADERDVSIRVKWHSEHRSLMVDRTRLSQILLNLLHNAIKFSPKGGEVSLDLHAKPGLFEAKVLDRGPGISTEKLKDLFTMFGESDKTDSKHSSSGLGLSIVKKNIELLGGTIQVEQEFPHGAIFKISIPQADHTIAN